MVILFYFIGGAFLGSFAYCLSYDLVHHSVRFDRRSACDNCHHSLSFFDLIPLLSQFFLRFRCRYCHHPSSITYFLSEAVAACCTGWLAYLYPNQPLFVIFLSITLLLMTFTDIQALWVPDSLQCILFGLGIYQLFHSSTDVFFQLAWSFWITIVLVSLWFIRPQSLGGADVKAIISFSLFIPLLNFPLFLGVASVSGISFILLRRDYHSPIPFIPFLTFGFIIALTF